MGSEDRCEDVEAEENTFSEGTNIDENVGNIVNISREFLPFCRHRKSNKYLRSWDLDLYSR